MRDLGGLNTLLHRIERRLFRDFGTLSMEISRSRRPPTFLQQSLEHDGLVDVGHAQSVLDEVG